MVHVANTPPLILHSKPATPEPVSEPAKENDVLLIANAGAYGYAMSSHYNLRDPAFEVLI